MDVLASRRRAAPPSSASEPEKSETMTAAEAERWLEEFGHLDNDLEDLNFRF